jgi:hypothetical protein
MISRQAAKNAKKTKSFSFAAFASLRDTPFFSQLLQGAVASKYEAVFCEAVYLISPLFQSLSVAAGLNFVDLSLQSPGPKAAAPKAESRPNRQPPPASGPSSRHPVGPNAIRNVSGFPLLTLRARLRSEPRPLGSGKNDLSPSRKER